MAKFQSILHLKQTIAV